MGLRNEVTEAILKFAPKGEMPAGRRDYYRNPADNLYCPWGDAARDV